MRSRSTISALAAPAPSRLTPREARLLAVALRLLQERGYDGLTVEAVATEARSSKATIYRRWPSKEELVLAAFVEGTRSSQTSPRTGSLRSDLLVIGASVCQHVGEHASTMRAVLAEMARSPALTAAFHDRFVDQRRLVMEDVISEAVARGEIDAEAVTPETYDLLVGYLVFRSLVSDEPPTEHTIHSLVDKIVMPSLMRNRERQPKP
ncbi:TetR/AcrR family transcriptional regulator [Mycolicibacterium sp. Dal123E01]|uniref:TetR/AcrR family transcriptional regulator n=1 Tax=Mycolicibacterium sp. Dal123E01 TaxID=3457578 RepID=UPI00403EADFA